MRGLRVQAREVPAERDVLPLRNLVERRRGLGRLRNREATGGRALWDAREGNRVAAGRRARAGGRGRALGGHDRWWTGGGRRRKQVG